MNEDLYSRIDEDEDMSDAEKRETYEAVAEQAQQEWIDENW